MKIKTYAAVLMVAFAWILWMNDLKYRKMFGFPTGFTSETWTIVEAFDRKEECQRVRASQVAKIKQGTREKLFPKLRHICLPSDFDPRR
jgi:hypothetical protein